MSNLAGEAASASDEAYPPNRWAQQEEASTPRRASKLRRIVAVAMILSVVVGGAYASFVASHVLSYPSSSAPIVNKNLSYTFVANMGTPALAQCTSTSCSFNVGGSGSVTVTASTSLQSGSGVSVTLIQAAPLSTPCSPNPPTTGTGVVAIPLPGQTGPVTFTGGTDYAYCIYYTSGPSIIGGSFAVDYSA